MKFYIFLILIFTFVGINQLHAQEIWSLEKCINYAYENNLDLKQKQIEISIAQIDHQLAKDKRLPNLNGNVGYNINFAGANDPTTFIFSSGQTSYNNLSLESEVTVYQGGRLRKEIEIGVLNLRNAVLDKELTKNDKSLLIASSYLEVLQKAEELEIARNQKKLTQERKLNTEKLINAGLLPEGDIIELESDLVSDDKNIITSLSLYDLAFLNLKLLLDLDPDKEIQLENPPELEPSIELINSYNIDEIYNAALNNQPIIEQTNVQKLIAEKNLELEKTNRYPTLVVGGNLSANYASTRGIPDIESIEIEGYRPIGILGTDVSAVVNEPILNFKLNRTSYFTQLKDNFLQNIGAVLVVPIFNRFQVKNGIERKKLNIRSAEIGQKVASQNLNREIRKAYADALAASKIYEASQKSIEAKRTAYDYTKKKFKLGVSTALELQIAQSALSADEISAKSNKYDYLFKLKEWQQENAEEAIGFFGYYWQLRS